MPAALPGPTVGTAGQRPRGVRSAEVPMFARVSHVRYPPEHHDAGLRVVDARNCCRRSGGRPATGGAASSPAASRAPASPWCCGRPRRPPTPRRPTATVSAAHVQARRTRAGDRGAADLRGRRPRRPVRSRPGHPPRAARPSAFTPNRRSPPPIPFSVRRREEQARDLLASACLSTSTISDPQ